VHVLTEFAASLFRGGERTQRREAGGDRAGGLLVTGWLSPRERARRGWNTGGSGAANNNAVIIHA
jgi:hypothetical protein